MYSIYMDSGTSNTRAYLIRGGEPIDSVKRNMGTKDSAITGSNDVLLRALKDAYDELIARNGLAEADVSEVWLSGMITNNFGIVEVPHMPVPIDAEKMYRESARYYEDRYFKRELCLVRGARTVEDLSKVNAGNIETVNNVRGEEIEIVGIAASELAPKGPFVVVSPGSHTHLLYVKNGALADIVSNFTGELNHAVSTQTILSGELDHGAVKMEQEYVKKGYDYLKRYGIARALYIVHATRVFEVCTDAHRTQLLAGIIGGSVAEILAKTVREKWTDTEKIIILGGQEYVESYRILIREALPELPVTVTDGKSYALYGALELLKLAAADKKNEY